MQPKCLLKTCCKPVKLSKNKAQKWNKINNKLSQNWWETGNKGYVCMYILKPPICHEVETSPSKHIHKKNHSKHFL